MLLRHMEKPVGLALEGGHVLGRNTRRGKPVGTLPAHLGTEHGPCRRQPLMQRRQAEVTRRMRLFGGPVDLVIGAIGFDGALFQITRLGLHVGEAAHVEGPQVHAGIAMQDEIRHGETRTSRCGDARGEAAGNVEVLVGRRLAHDRFAIRRDGNGAIDDALDPDLVQHRKSGRGGKREELQPLHVGLQQFAPEGQGRQAAVEAFRTILPAANGEAAGIGLEVEIVVRVAQRGETGIEG